MVLYNNNELWTIPLIVSFFVLVNLNTPKVNFRNRFFTFFIFNVFLHRAEKIPSVQSLVATSSRPNICGAVIALGFILISLWGATHTLIAFIRVWIHVVLPEPLGPRAIMPCRTNCVSYSCYVKRYS